MTDALPLVERLRGLIGLVLIIAIGVIFSRNRRQIPWTVVAWGFALQVIFAIFVLRIPAGQQLFRKLGDIVTTILNYSYQGSQFVFGEIGKQHSSIGVVFAFQILPAIIFVSALFAIMYYLGIMQVIVRAFAVVMAKLMKTSGAESLDVAASIFMGQTEAPLTIRPFLSKMTRSELMTVMTAGMAHISGSIMVAYIAFGVDAKHLLTAVIMTAPGTIMMAKIFEPEDGHPETYGNVKLDIPKQDVNLVAAAARGTSEGLQLMLNVIAMLISFVALVALLNGIFGVVHGWLPWWPQTLQVVLGWIGRPIAWAMGVSWADSGDRRQPARHPRRAERVHRLRRAGPAQGNAGSALLHHRLVRARRVRQLRLGRHPDRRHRRARPRSQGRPRPARLPRHARRHAGQLPVRHDRRHAAVTTATDAVRAFIGQQPSGGPHRARERAR